MLVDLYFLRLLGVPLLLKRLAIGSGVCLLTVHTKAVALCRRDPSTPPNACKACLMLLQAMLFSRHRPVMIVTMLSWGLALIAQPLLPTEALLYHSGASRRLAYGYAIGRYEISRTRICTSSAFQTPICLSLLL